MRQHWLRPSHCPQIARGCFRRVSTAFPEEYIKAYRAGGRVAVVAQVEVEDGVVDDDATSPPYEIGYDATRDAVHTGRRSHPGHRGEHPTL